MQPTELLRIPFLAGLERDDLAQALATLEPFSVGPGEVLVEAGEVDDALLLLLEGEVSIQVGEPPLEVARARAGEVVGETALFRPAWRREAGVVTAKACRVVVLTGERIAALRARRSPVLAAIERHALRSIGRRLRRVAMQAPPEALEVHEEPAPEGLFDRIRQWFWAEARPSVAASPPPIDALLERHHTAQAAQRLSARFGARSLRAEEVLVDTVDPDPPLLLVGQGTVELRDPRGNPDEQRVVGRLGAGSLVNPLSVVHGHVPLYRAVSVRGGWVYSLPRATVTELLHDPGPDGAALRMLLYTALFDELVTRNSVWHDRWIRSAA